MGKMDWKPLKHVPAIPRGTLEINPLVDEIQMAKVSLVVRNHARTLTCRFLYKKHWYKVVFFNMLSVYPIRIQNSKVQSTFIHIT